MPRHLAAVSEHEDDEDASLFDEGARCELCGWTGGDYDSYEVCEECGLLLCRRCWGPRCVDDLYAGWCFSCAG